MTDPAQPLVPRVPRETALSLLSRLASRLQIDPTELAFEIGISIKRVANVDRIALEKLVAVAGFDETVVEDLATWSGEAIGDVRMRFRDEIFVTRALRGSTIRGCPTCLREDAERYAGPALEAMAMRGDWQLRYQHVCIRHRRPLVLLWKAETILERRDIRAQLRAIQADVISGALDAPAADPSGYDIWLDVRLSDGQDDTALSAHGAYAAAEFCRLLGGQLLRLNQTAVAQDEDLLRASARVGFEVASNGEAEIRQALRSLTALATDGQHKAKYVFGEMYEVFSRDLADEPAFDAFRELVRDQIMETWAVAEGENVIGTVTGERRLHSVRSASDETGMIPSVLRELLEAKGAIDKDDPRPDGLATFDAQAFKPLLEDIPNLVGRREIERQMGASIFQFDALVREGLISPITNRPRFRAPWFPSDGKRFVDGILKYAGPMGPSEDGWEHISRAAARMRTGLRSLLKAIEAGSVRCGKRDGLAGYASIFVMRSDVEDLADLSAGATNDRPKTVPEFARILGLRAHGNFERLVKDGHTPATKMVNPATGHKALYITQEDADAFHARFVTASILAQQSGTTWRAVRTDLLARGVEKFQSEGRRYGLVFLKADVEVARA